ncbi:MAG: sugar ABC transporter permease [Planctomycetota bacterium]|nr:sugar ABC transporter permease [Planctomycetota bacterium]
MAETTNTGGGIWEVLKKNTMLIALVLVMAFFHFYLIYGQGNARGFINPATITNLISQNAYVIVLATGMLLCILTGGNIDLSVGSIVALVGALAGVFMTNWGVHPALAVLMCLLAGLLIGAFHGFWIAYMKIPPFIVTLAGMMLWRGLALVVLNGNTIALSRENYSGYWTGFLSYGKGHIGTQRVDELTLIVGAILTLILVVTQIRDRLHKSRSGYAAESGFLFGFKLLLYIVVMLGVTWLLACNKGIPVILIVIAVIVAGYHYFTARTVPGRYLYAIGGNEKAARMSGVNTNRMMFFAYANMGFLSGVAALMCVARLNSASPSAGTGYELDAIASCFIGGASAYGGTGTVAGAVIGAIFMGVLNQGMSLAGVDANWQQAVKGSVLLIAVVFDVISQKRKQSA